MCKSVQNANADKGEGVKKCVDIIIVSPLLYADKQSCVRRVVDVAFFLLSISFVRSFSFHLTSPLALRFSAVLMRLELTDVDGRRLVTRSDVCCSLAAAALLMNPSEGRKMDTHLPTNLGYMSDPAHYLSGCQVRTCVNEWRALDDVGLWGPPPFHFKIPCGPPSL